MDGGQRRRINNAMSQSSHKRQSQIVETGSLPNGDSASLANQLKRCRVMIAGLGNIGSFLALFLAPLVGFVRLVDRDWIEPHNATNQLYGPDKVDCMKVEAVADLLKQRAPELRLEQHATDLEDLPWGYFADIDVCFGGLDSLRTRQIVAERTFTLGVPYIDGGVGEPLLARVQVLLSGQACIECGWSHRYYRQLATEVPCHGGSARIARTLSPACVGATVAGLMVAQLIRLFSESPPTASYEISGDLVAGRFVSSQLRRCKKCRFGHEIQPCEFGLETDFEHATLANVVELLRSRFDEQDLQIEVRRGIFDEPLFASSGFVGLQQLSHHEPSRLADLGLTSRDRFVIRSSSGTSHLRLDSK